MFNSDEYTQGHPRDAQVLGSFEGLDELTVAANLQGLLNEDGDFITDDGEQDNLASIPSLECATPSERFPPDSKYADPHAHRITYPVQSKPPKVVHNYLLGGVLGEGAYGKVREAVNLLTMRRVAIKICKLRRLRRHKNAIRNIESEINIMQMLTEKQRNCPQSPYCLALLEVIRSNERVYLVLELALGPLQSLIDCQPQRCLPVPVVQGVFKQLMLGLQFLHSCGVMHKDIKPSNIMVMPDGSVRISDFGVAEQLSVYQGDDLCPHTHGSPAFQSPQIASGAAEVHGIKADVWAAGVTLFAMLTGNMPFASESLMALYERIIKDDFPRDQIPGECLSLLDGMLEKDEHQRYDVHEVLQHPWVHQADMIPRDTPYVVWCFSGPMLDADLTFSNSARTPSGLSGSLRDGGSLLLAEDSDTTPPIRPPKRGGWPNVPGVLTDNTPDNDSPYYLGGGLRSELLAQITPPSVTAPINVVGVPNKQNLQRSVETLHVPATWTHTESSYTGSVLSTSTTLTQLGASYDLPYLGSQHSVPRLTPSNIATLASGGGSVTEQYLRELSDGQRRRHSGGCVHYFREELLGTAPAPSTRSLNPVMCPDCMSQNSKQHTYYLHRAMEHLELPVPVDTRPPVREVPAPAAPPVTPPRVSVAAAGSVTPKESPKDSKKCVVM